VFRWRNKKLIKEGEYKITVITCTKSIEETRKQKYKDQQQQEGISSKAYELFSQGKTPLQVAIALNIRQSEATKYYREYWKLRGLQMLDCLYIKTNGKIWPLWKLYKEVIKKKRMSIEQVANGVEIAIHKLPYMESLYRQIKDEANKLHYVRQGLVNNIETKKNKISLLDKIAFSIEQNCIYPHPYDHPYFGQYFSNSDLSIQDCLQLDKGNN
jgi:hypothetical protein